MSFSNKKNNAFSTLLSTHTSADGHIIIQVGDQTKFPSSFPFRITVYKSTLNKSTGTIFVVNSAASNNFAVTVDPGQSPASVDQTFDVTTGTFIVECDWTYADTQEYESAITALQGRFPIQTADIGALQVTGAKIAAGTITPDKVATYTRALVTRSSDANIATGTSVPINWGTVTYNIGGIFVIGTPSVFTALVAGYYRIAANLRWATDSATGYTDANILLNGGTILHYNDLAASSAVNMNNFCYIEYFLNVGDFVQVVAFQNSGITRVVTGSNSYFSISLMP